MKPWMIWAIGVVLGGAAGFAYWFYIGCTTGSCAITSSPVNSSLYGALMGGMIVNVLNDRKKKS